LFAGRDTKECFPLKAQSAKKNVQLTAALCVLLHMDNL